MTCSICKKEIEINRGNAKVLPNIRIPDNIKITTPDDLEIAEKILRSRCGL